MYSCSNLTHYEKMRPMKERNICQLSEGIFDKIIVYILDKNSFFYEMMQTFYHGLYFIGIGIND